LPVTKYYSWHYNGCQPPKEDFCKRIKVDRSSQAGPTCPRQLRPWSVGTSRVAPSLDVIDFLVTFDHSSYLKIEIFQTFYCNLFYHHQ
jgi:hypothetical protein